MALRKALPNSWPSDAETHEHDTRQDEIRRYRSSLTSPSVPPTGQIAVP